MGLFDRVYANCPNCGTPVEFQSKAGECYMNVYTVENAPREILEDVINSPEYCAKCGHWSVLYDPAFPPERPVPKPTMRAVREPAEGESHHHDTQTYIRWWDAPFVEADMLPPPTKDRT